MTMVASTNGEGGVVVSGPPAHCENVKVVVRVRPLNDKELAADYRNIIVVDSINGSIKLSHLNQTRYQIRGHS